MLKHELHRKGIHIASAAIPLSTRFIPLDLLISLLTTGTILFVFIDYFRRYNPLLQKVFSFLAGYAMREREEKHLRLTGATWVLISYLLMLKLFPLNIAVPSMLLLAWGDAAAALVGQQWGRLRWYKSYTVEGTLAFIVVGLAIFLIGFPSFPLWMVFVVVAVTALGESLVYFIDDNVFIPLFSGSLLFLLTSIVG